MPHLEDRLPVNPLILQQRVESYLPNRDRPVDEEGNRVNSTDDTEAPQPGSLANGIDRVTLSANARVIVPVQTLDRIVPSLDDNPAAPTVREFLNVSIQQNRETDARTTENNVTRTGLRDRAEELQTSHRVDESETRGISNRQNIPEPPATPLAPAIPPAALALNLNTEPAQAGGAAAPIFNRAEPLNPVEPARETHPVPANAIPAPEIPDEPAARVVAGLRSFGASPAPLEGTPAPVDPEPVDFRISPALQEDIEGPRTPPPRNFDSGRTLSLNLEPAGNENPLIALNSIEDVLERSGAIQGPESPVFQAEAIIPAAASIAIPGEAEAAAPDLLEEAEADLSSGFTPPAASPAGLLIVPTQESAETPQDFQENDLEPPLPGPRDAGTSGNVLVIPEPETPDGPVQTDTERLTEESRTFEELQPPAFPELDPDEPLAFVREREPVATENELLEFDQAPDNVPLSVVNAAGPVPPVPGNVETINESPQALRGDNLGTDPALRSNREIRNFLQQFNANIETPEEVTELEGAPVTEVQNNAPPPPAVFENLEALGEALLESVREQESRESVTRPEEEHTAPPEPRTPETVLTERGQNIDRFI